MNANAAPGADLIDFSSFFNTPQTITLASEISITGAVTINGTSAANVTISGNNAVRIFDTQAAPGGTTISLADLTLQHGSTSGNGAAVCGGDEMLSFARCRFTANIADFGGAVFVGFGGSLNLADCAFDNNSTFSGGGAIYVLGSLTATNTTFNSNSATAPYGGGAIVVYNGSLSATDCAFTSNVSGGGGAIFANTGTSGTVLNRCDISHNTTVGGSGGGLITYGSLVIEASTVSGNTAFGVSNQYGYYPSYGGGISSNGQTTIRNSTISGNMAGSAGGIDATGVAALVVQNSTIAGNVARYIYVGGGGIAGGAIMLESSIVANNTSAFTGPDISATTVTAKNSSIFSHSGIVTFTSQGGNRPEGEDPRLGPLQNNGGSTKTRALLPGSPCANAGTNPANLATDQRGPGFPRVLAGAPDMGAVEGVDPVPTATLTSVLSTITVAGGTSYSVVVRYDDDVGIDLATIDLNDLRVTGPGYATPQAPTSRVVSGSGQLVTVTYTFPAPGGAFDWTDDGIYTATVIANQVRDVDSTPHFVVAGTLCSFRVAIAFSLTVDEVSDIDDGNTTPGHLSLREAVRLTNAAVQTADTIMFDPAVFSTPNTIVLAGGQFGIDDPLTVIGPGSALLTLDAAGSSRHFVSFVPGTSDVVNLSGLNLVNGAANTGYGGAIDARGGLTLSDVMISNCRGYDGGGAIIAHGPLTMRDCAVSNNQALGVGGALIASSPTGADVLLERCSFDNNSADGTGGALYLSVTGLLQISQCTISGNRANTASWLNGSGGGAAFIVGWSLATGSIIRNSTISGNVAGSGSAGGGLSLYFYGPLTITNSTITGNTTTGAGGGIAVRGGYYGSFGDLRLNSTIIAGNSAGSAAGGGPDLYFNSTFPINVTANNSLIGVANSGTFTLMGAGNLTGTLASPLNPQLAPLANNGGPTKTHALLPRSPAINVGNNAAGLAYDQRGTGYPRVVGTAADIGAFELLAPRVASVTVNDGSAQRSRITSLTVTFDSQVSFSGPAAGAFTLLRNGGNPVSFSATPSVQNGVTVVTISNFTGVETQFSSLGDGRYTLTALSSRITGPGGALDGDNDGSPGGNFAFGEAQGLFRFFGDINGDRRVDIADFGLFSISYLNPSNFNSAFDFNGDGRIDILDFGQFSARYLATLP